MLATILFSVVTIAAISMILLRLWVRLSVVRCDNNVSMSGKTVVITGATAGIGRETAVGLARKGAHIILGCYNMENGKAAKDYIQRASDNANITIKPLNLASLKSVREFAGEIAKEETKIDVLINNAGILAPAKKIITEDGFELTFATNYFGHFLLTNLLLDLLKKSESGRIVSLSSTAHTMGYLNLEDKDFHKNYYHWGPYYGHTKLAICLFVRELSKRLAGTGVTINSVHPGTCGSALFVKPGLSAFFVIFQAVGGLWWRTPEEGAQTSIYLATSEDVRGVSGKYFVDCAAAQPSQAARNDEKAHKLFEMSEQLTGL